MPKWDRRSWVSLSPNGLGHIKPNHYLEMAKVVWRNRDQLPYAWRILTRGVCDGCALGTSGVRDFTMDGVHLCMVRLDLLRLNTMPALDIRHLADVEQLSRMTAAQLRELGRLPYPMIRRRGEPGFRRVSWDEALQTLAARAAQTAPERLAFYMTSRGLTNETYYVAQKVARFFGANNVDNSSRICHAPSTVALKQSLGVGAATCSYTDWLGTDLLIFFGSNTPNNQPVTTKYIYHAKKLGTRVIVINPYREPGLERYWVPSVAESALFGTRLADAFFQVHTGGDRAFIAGVLKHLIANDWLDKEFIAAYTLDFAELRTSLQSQDWEQLEEESGASREEMLRLARLLGEAKSAVFVWSMGITQHRDGVANVRAIANLALARGFVGREKCGLVPIRGHSGVQGGAEVGAVPNQLPGGVAADEAGARQFSDLWGFAVPTTRGLNAVEMIDAAHRGEMDFFYQIGGNFLETLPEPEYVREAVARIPVRAHQDIVLSPQMLVEPQETVVLLPAETRYEQRGGGTETSTERRILFSPEIPGRRIGEAKPEWEIPMLFAEAARPQQAALIHFADAQAIRAEIARAVPAYAGIERLQKAGDMTQWGGVRLCETIDEQGRRFPHFPTPDGKARFSSLPSEPRTATMQITLSTEKLSDKQLSTGQPSIKQSSTNELSNINISTEQQSVSQLSDIQLSTNKLSNKQQSTRRLSNIRLSTRRGKQFNSIVHRNTDPLNGARRDAVLLNAADAERLGIKTGDPVIVRSSVGEMRGRCQVAPILAGNVQVHWPEGNVLLERGDCDPQCGIPDYNAVVTVERVEDT